MSSTGREICSLESAECTGTVISFTCPITFISSGLVRFPSYDGVMRE